MAIVKKYQNSFSGGVFSPAAYVRTDLDKYSSGCKRMENAIPLIHGGFTRRPGTRYVDTVPGDGMLFPFTYSVGQAYALLFYEGSGKNLVMRVYCNGEAVLKDGIPYEITTPFSHESVRDIKFVQSADVMFFAHPDVRPVKLERRGHTDWRFVDVEFMPHIGKVGNLKAVPNDRFVDDSDTYVETEVSYKVSAVSARQLEGVPSEPATAATLSTWPSGARVNLSWDAVPGADHYVVYKNARGYYAYIGAAEGPSFVDDNIEGDSKIAPKDNRDPFNPPAVPGGVEGPAGETYFVRVSAVNSAGAESPASVEAPFAEGEITFEPVEHAAGYYIYYRSSGDTAWSQLSADPEGTAIPGDTAVEGVSPHDRVDTYPGAVGIYQQRLIYGRSNAQPHTVWMSETGAFDSMAISVPLREDSAITATVDSRQMNEIRHFVCLKNVLMMTSGGEFQVGSSSGSTSGRAITPSSLSFTPQSTWGSSSVPPIVSGVNVLFVENSGKVVRDLKFQLTEDGFVGDDVTVLAEHLFTSEIRDWAFQQAPWNVVWTCLENGDLLSFTYMREQSIWAWAKHPSSGGKFRSVVSIREGAEDNVYYLVQRTVGGVDRYFVEYQERTGYGEPVENSWFVDCGLNGTFEEPVSRLTGLNHLAGEKVDILADGSVAKGKTVSADGTVDIGFSARKIVAGLGYALTVETLDPEINGADGTTADLKKVVVRASFVLRESRGLLAGPDDGHLQPLLFPVSAVYGEPHEPFSGTLDMALTGMHRTEATLVMHQEDPLPLTVLALISRVSVG